MIQSLEAREPVSARYRPDTQQIRTTSPRHRTTGEASPQITAETRIDQGECRSGRSAANYNQWGTTSGTFSLSTKKRSCFRSLKGPTRVGPQNQWTPPKTPWPELFARVPVQQRCRHRSIFPSVAGVATGVGDETGFTETPEFNCAAVCRNYRRDLQRPGSSRPRRIAANWGARSAAGATTDRRNTDRWLTGTRARTGKSERDDIFFSGTAIMNANGPVDMARAGKGVKRRAW